MGLRARPIWGCARSGIAPFLGLADILLRIKIGTRCIMPQIISPPSRESVSPVPAERERPTGGSDAGSTHGTGSEYYSFVYITSPTSRTNRHVQAQRRRLRAHKDNEHQAKRRRTNAPLAIAKGNVPLQKTWEMTELSKGLLLKFRVGPLALSWVACLTNQCLYSLTLKGNCSTLVRTPIVRTPPVQIKVARTPPPAQTKKVAPPPRVGHVCTTNDNY